MELEFEPRFLDEVVLRTVAARPEGRRFYRERERAYRIADPEERARAFDALNVAWCDRLDLARPLRDALAEQPLVLAGVARCAVGRPPRPRDAGAELLVRAPERGERAAAARALRLLLAPEALLDAPALTAFLRRELQHVADMLDPRFGYEPRLPAVSGGPAYERLLRERYRVVWDVTVDGRLVRAGRLPATVQDERREEFVRAFPAGDDDEIADHFARFFADPAPTHAAIAAFVIGAPAPGRAGVCGLCGFPTADREPDVAALPAAVRAAMARDVPGWTPGDGCCRQCADLYRARPLALAAAAALPGIR